MVYSRETLLAQPQWWLLPPGGGLQPTSGSQIFGALWAIILSGGRIALGLIKPIIARYGWTIVASFLSASVAQKIINAIDGGESDLFEIDIPGTGTGTDGLSKVVKQWSAHGWPFSMTADGRIHTVTKSGIQKSWKPHKPIVLFRGHTTLSQFVRAQRYLDKLARTIAKRTKALKLA